MLVELFFVVFGEVGVYSGLKLSHRREASASNGLCSDTSKEALDHVEPGTASGSETPGVDGRTWQSYKQNLEVNLAELGVSENKRNRV
jgi:hypothetical protein